MPTPSPAGGGGAARPARRPGSPAARDRRGGRARRARGRTGCGRCRRRRRGRAPATARHRPVLQFADRRSAPAATPTCLHRREGHSRAATQPAYGIDHELSDAEFAELAESWRPFRTWVTVMLRALVRPQETMTTCRKETRSGGACQRLNEVLAGRELTRSEFRVPSPGHHRPDRGRRTRGRLPRQAPALPVRQRLHPAHPLPDGRRLADLPARPAAGAAGRTSRSGRCWPPPSTPAVGYRLPVAELLPDRRRGQRGRAPRPGSARPRLGPRRGRPPDRGPTRAHASARRCWTSATWPASAPSTAPSCCSCRASTRVRRSREVPNLRRVVQRGQQLLYANRWRPEQSTTGDLRPGRRAYVFERPGQPCRRCGTPIQTEEFGPRGPGTAQLLVPALPAVGDDERPDSPTR